MKVNELEYIINCLKNKLNKSSLLSKDERRKGRLWRIKKCGSNDFDVLKHKFEKEVDGRLK